MAVLKVGSDGKAPANAKIGDTIVTAGGNYKITGGTAGNWKSEKVNGSGGGGTDYSAIIRDSNTSPEQKQTAFDARTAKETSMRADGTWNDSWAPTSQLLSYVRPYEHSTSAYENRLQANNDQASELYRKMVQQGTDRLNAQRSDVNARYDDAAQQAYISHMQGQRAMPGQLAALGMTGGASESSMLQAQAAYQNNLNSVNTARGKALNDIDTAITDLRNSGDIQIAQAILNNADKSTEAYWNALQSDIGRSDDLNRWYSQKAMQEAGLTGMYNGNRTMDGEQWAYSQQQDAYDRALQTAQMTGNFSAMRQFGWTDEQIRAANAQLTSSGGTGRSGGGGGYSAVLAPVTYGDEGSAYKPSYDTSMYDMASISNLGYGPVDMSTLERLIASGEVEVRMEGGKLKAYRTNKTPSTTALDSNNPFALR